MSVIQVAPNQLIHKIWESEWTHDRGKLQSSSILDFPNGKMVADISSKIDPSGARTKYTAAVDMHDLSGGSNRIELVNENGDKIDINTYKYITNMARSINNRIKKEVTKSLINNRISPVLQRKSAFYLQLANGDDDTRILLCNTERKEEMQLYAMMDLRTSKLVDLHDRKYFMIMRRFIHKYTMERSMFGSYINEVMPNNISGIADEVYKELRAQLLSTENAVYTISQPSPVRYMVNEAPFITVIAKATSSHKGSMTHKHLYITIYRERISSRPINLKTVINDDEDEGGSTVAHSEVAHWDDWFPTSEEYAKSNCIIQETIEKIATKFREY